MNPNEVEIEYCVPCGLLDAAEKTAHALLSRYGARLSAVRLVTGRGGVFRVSVGEKVLFDKTEEGFDLDAIVARVGEALTAESALRL